MLGFTRRYSAYTTRDAVLCTHNSAMPVAPSHPHTKARCTGVGAMMIRYAGRAAPVGVATPDAGVH